MMPRIVVKMSSMGMMEPQNLRSTVQGPSDKTLSVVVSFAIDTRKRVMWDMDVSDIFPIPNESGDNGLVLVCRHHVIHGPKVASDSDTAFQYASVLHG
jgi:hypothetical protein